MTQVAVIGSGLMGSGIAQVTSLGGSDVTLIDTDEGALERALAAIRTSLDRFVAKDKVSAEDAAGALARITTATDVEAAAPAEIAVEAVFVVGTAVGVMIAHFYLSRREKAGALAQHQKLFGD